MKSPTVAIEVRWRLTGTESWMVKRFLPGAPIKISEIERDEEYEVEARSIGVGDLASAWVAATITVPDTNRRGVAALPVTSIGNAPSRWVAGTEVTWTSTETEATINVSAGTLQVAEKQIAYAASSLVIEDGTPEETRYLWLYYDDPRLEGGARTLGASTSPVTAMAGPARILVSPVLIQFDESGGSGGGGGGDIGGGGGGGGGPPPIHPEILP